MKAEKEIINIDIYNNVLNSLNTMACSTFELKHITSKIT